MALISKETWDNMPENEKTKIVTEYNYKTTKTGKVEYEILFGKETLQSKPKIKTWDDFLKEFHKEEDWNPKHELADLSLYGMTDKVKEKIIATARIAKLIELGYGGMVTEEEWKDKNCRKYTIEYYPQDPRKFVNAEFNIGECRFITFHTPEQRAEFMSYPENRTLVDQYFMIN